MALPAALTGYFFSLPEGALVAPAPILALLVELSRLTVVILKVLLGVLWLHLINKKGALSCTYLST